MKFIKIIFGQDTFEQYFKYMFFKQSISIERNRLEQHLNMMGVE